MCWNSITGLYLQIFGEAISPMQLLKGQVVYVSNLNVILNLSQAQSIWISLWGGTQIWFGQGFAAWASNPYPILRVIFAEKGTHFDWFFWKYRSIFPNLEKNRPIFRDIFIENGTHV